MALVGFGSQHNSVNLGSNAALELKETLGGKAYTVRSLKVDPGKEDVKILILDMFKDESDDQFVSALHTGFKFNGKFGSTVVSLDGVDERGCPFSKALQSKNKWGKLEPKRPSRCWILTGIVLEPYIIKGGPNEGKSIPATRVMIPVPLGFSPESKANRAPTFARLAKKKDGLRGLVCSVSRNTGQMSSRIGDDWSIDEKLTEDQMRERVRPAADYYKIPVDDFLRPMNYREVFKPMPYEKAVAMAKAVSAGDFGGGTVTTKEAAPVAGRGDAYESDSKTQTGDGGSGDEDNEIPF